MTFNANIPQPNDFLSDSQAQLLINNQQLDSGFDVDHTTFTPPATPTDRGKHKSVTSILQTADLSTAVNEVKLYSIEKTATLGPLQFSRGENDANPSPVTLIHSPNTTVNIGTTNVIDFTGCTLVIGSVNIIWKDVPGARNETNESISFGFDTAGFYFGRTQTDNNVRLVATGNILQITTVGVAKNIWWTLRLDRVITP